MTKTVFNFLILSIILISLLPINSFSYEFTENFEYEDSPINHGWEFCFSGSDSTIFTSKESFSNGERSLKGYVHNEGHTRVGLRYDFTKTEFGEPIESADKISFSIKFYDQYAGESYIEKYFRKYLYDKNGYVKKPWSYIYSNKNRDSARFTIAFDFLATESYEKYITISSSGDEYSYWKGNGWEDIKVRERGWHEVKFEIVENQVSLFFDGNIVAKNLHYVHTAQNINWKSNIIAPNVKAYSWIDDVNFKKN
jgi:hypothetical protein